MYRRNKHIEFNTWVCWQQQCICGKYIWIFSKPIKLVVLKYIDRRILGICWPSIIGYNLYIWSHLCMKMNNLTIDLNLNWKMKMGGQQDALFIAISCSMTLGHYHYLNFKYPSLFYILDKSNPFTSITTIKQ